MEELVVLFDRKFWRNKTVFLTGHTGFKGSWLALTLSMMGCRVVGYSLAPSTTPNMFTMLNLPEICAENHVADIADTISLQKAVLNSDADILIHMAAQPIVSEGFVDPVGTFTTNVMGTINFLEAYRSFGKGVALVVSSDKCYANKNDGKPLAENDPIGGKDPYSASKAGTELVTECWRSSFFSGVNDLRVASVRAGNVVGGGDWSSNRLVPDLAKAFSNGLPAAVRNPYSTRPWQFVLEPIVAYLVLCERLTESLEYARPWNIGPPPKSRHSVGDIADLAMKYWPGNSANWNIEDTSKTFPEAQYLSLDSSDFVTEFGWSCKLSIEETMERTMRWYFDFYTQGASVARQTTMDQIEDYLG